MRALRMVVCGVAVGCLGLAALAQPPAGGKPPAGGGGGEGQPPAGQPGGGGGRGGGFRGALSPEKAKAAWELEAKSVAAGLSLKDDQTTAVVKAYSDARTSQDAEFSKLREKAREEGGGGGGDMRQAMEDLMKTQREKLEKALGDAKLSKDQVTKAMASLGTFNRQWDNMTDTIAGFKLEAKKQADAMKATEEFVSGQAKARESAGDDREAMRTAMQEARKKLLDTIKGLVSDEQFTQFQAAMGGGRGGRGGGADGPAPRPRPGDGAPPPPGKS